MAKGKKTGGRNFEKGHSRNKGIETLTSEDKAAREITRVVFRRIIEKYLDFNLSQLQDTLKDPKTTALDLIVVKIMAMSINSGDQHRMEFLLNHLLGKLPDKLDLSNPDGTLNAGKHNVVMVLPSNGKEAVKK